MKKLLLILLFNSLAAQPVSGQDARQLFDEGNDAYLAKNFSQAQVFYEKAIQKDVRHELPEIYFNFGNALYQQKKFDEAVEKFQLLLRTNASVSLKSAAIYNIGNCYMKQKKYDAAASVYEQVLRGDPNDEDARYNLTYALALSGQKRPSGYRQQTEPQSMPNMPPPPNLSQDDLNRMLNDLASSESQTLQSKKKQIEKKDDKDW